MGVCQRFILRIFALWFVPLALVGAHGQTTLVPEHKTTTNETSRAARNAGEQWHLHGRMVSGQASAAMRYRAYRQKLAMRAARNKAGSLSPNTSSPVGWTSLGPAPLASDATGQGEQDYSWVSGRATAVAVDPTDPSGNTVYVGGAYGGLWRSANAGSLCPDPSIVTWNAPTGNLLTCLGSVTTASLLDGQPTLSVGAIAIQPGNTVPAQSVILVGTGETNSSTDSYYGLGILRSADAGNSWTLIPQDGATPPHSFAGIGFSQIAFSTSNPSVVLAAAAGASQGLLDGLEDPAEANLGIYYSNDSGNNWNFAAVNDGAATVSGSSVTAVIYNAAYNAGAGAFFAAVRSHGFYISLDGVHWNRLSIQPGNGLTTASCPASPNLSTCPIYRGEIAVVPNRAGPNAMGEMYVWYVDANDNDQGIWQTVDGGNNWNHVDETGLTNCGDLIGGCGTENGSYNLTLAAVPDNASPNATAGTDLYAGAVNLYKCTILTGPASSGSPIECSGTGNTFLNLTHAYGCPPDLGSIAKVHPSQHAIDFLQINSNTQVVMYFANDGGIYRALDGYTDLTSGTCGTPNAFDSLNQTLGSMTQFVSLGQHPTDSNTLLGGTQGNGSPATATARTSANWISVNSGDGGYSEINPNNPRQWFTANTGVSIQSCSSGIACRAEDFTTVVSSVTLDDDAGPLYTPYMLDPQNSSELIVGTCRVWRGTTAGTAFAVLSNNFDTGTATTCTRSDVNMVRSLAVGGVVDSAGFSSVIYAGTDGTGPLAPIPSGGDVWVLNETIAPTWTEVTGAINPSNFPISAIALDPSDPSGDTAYVTIMGFGGSHIWQTTNGGNSWSDFTGISLTSLPDAPADAVLVNNGAIYVGTDVGVFASSTSSPSWAEVGGSGGPLPSVPVTALLMFNSGPTELLRAATYGRGVWQFPLTTTPDFQIAVPNPIQTIFAGQTATFSGILSAFNGYANPVTLSCVPAICTPASMTVPPSTSGTDFTLMASDAVGDYAFNLQGSDPNGLTHNAPLTLQVADFTLCLLPSLTPCPPSTGTTNLARGATSSVTFQLSFLGSFPAGGEVAFSCTEPSGVNCTFFPADSVGPGLGSSVAVTLTLAASSTAPTGSSSVTVTASSSSDAGPKTVSQTAQLTVTDSQDYMLVMSVPGPFATSQQAAVQGTLTGINGYGSKVTLQCVAGSTTPPPNCALSPASDTPSANGVAFSLTAGSNVTGSYSFNVQGVGRDVDSITHSAAVVLNFYDFQMSADSNAPPVNPGQTANYTIQVAPEGMSTFQQTVAFSCSSLPSLVSCAFAPSQIAGGSGTQSVALAISTVAPTASVQADRRFPLYATLLPFASLVLFVGIAGGRRQSALGLVCLLVMISSSCSGGLTGSGISPPPTSVGTTPATYIIVVNAVEGSGAAQLQHSIPVNLVVQ